MLNLEFADANIAGLITSGIRAARDGSVQKPYRVFAEQKLEVQQCTRRYIAEPLNRLQIPEMEKSFVGGGCEELEDFLNRDYNMKNL